MTTNKYRAGFKLLDQKPYIGQFLNLYDTQGKLLYPVEVVQVIEGPELVEAKCKLRINKPNLPVYVFAQYLKPHNEDNSCLYCWGSLEA